MHFGSLLTAHLSFAAQEDVTYLFKLADKDGDGKLTYDELAKVLSEIKDRFPQVGQSWRVSCRKFDRLECDRSC